MKSSKILNFTFSSEQETERADDVLEAAARGPGDGVPAGPLSRRVQAGGDRGSHQAARTESPGV